MGRSQVAYNRTHGRGRGRGSKKGRGQQQQQQQPQPSSSSSKKTIVGNDNSWRYQKPLSSSISSTSRSQSRQNEYDETATTLLNEYDNSVNYYHHHSSSSSSSRRRSDDDDDEDDMTTTTGLMIDVDALARVFKELPISIRLGLEPDFIGERVDEWDDRQRRREGSKEQITKTIAEMRVDDMLSLGVCCGRESGDGVVSVTREEMTVDEKESKVDEDNGVKVDDKQENDDNDNDDDDDDDDDEEDLDAWLDDIIS